MEVLKFYKALFDAALMSIEENFNQIFPAMIRINKNKKQKIKIEFIFGE